MAGYVMTVNKDVSIETMVESGVYSTILPEPKAGKWRIPQEGTFADYLSMTPGDSIYFFSERKIYGIGEIIKVGNDCKYLNYPKADVPEPFSDKDIDREKLLWKESGFCNRCLCLFKPSPYFFKKSVDMDDVLNSNPDKFRSIRTLWQLSFIKIDDEENKALQDIILKRNEEDLINKTNIFEYDNKIHEAIEKKLSQEYRLNAYQIMINTLNKKKNTLEHEMAIEAYLCGILEKENDTPFGRWDYISHQVAASPFKPIDYMDKMDIFGYRYIEGFKTISKYLVIEIKKDTAETDVIEQIMKYVDWISQEYAHGDYSMIEAYVVASDFPDDVIMERNKQCIRNFSKGYRPTQPCTWSDCKLISYRFNEDHLEFSEDKKSVDQNPVFC